MRCARRYVSSSNGAFAPRRFGTVSADQGARTMDLFSIIIVLVVAGVLLWLINTYVPMQGTIKSLLNGVVIIVLVIWLLQVFGVLSGIGSPRIHS
jgi:Flp pilus assembly protein TadB